MKPLEGLGSLLQREPLRLRWYRAALTRALKPMRMWAFPQVSSWIESTALKPKGDRTRIWFHAASVGELESLWTVIEAAAHRNHEILVTTFSSSALTSLEKLAGRLRSQDRGLIASGLSPWEGGWGGELKRAQPDLFVTAKYEAWPELWGSLACRRIPLAIVGAKDRPSLHWARRISRLLGVSLPRLYFLTAQEADSQGLALAWQDARINPVGDPRWDRVFSRALEGSDRAKEVVRCFGSTPRPWGVLGSVWLSDLDFLRDHLQSLPGTVWIVPHQVDSDSIAKIEKFLSELPLSWLKTKADVPIRALNPGEGSGSQVILVNEMGFLSELYGTSDWAFVGGGFEKGVHSTIEPAIHGIPIAAGPKRATRFSEIATLQETGQLKILSNQASLKKWLESLRFQIDSEFKERWGREAHGRKGATQSVLTWLEEILAGR